MIVGTMFQNLSVSGKRGRWINMSRSTCLLNTRIIINLNQIELGDAVLQPKSYCKKIQFQQQKQTNNSN